VPIPIWPATPETYKKGEEVPVSPITKIGVPVPTVPWAASIENWPQGVVEETPETVPVSERMPVPSALVPVKRATRFAVPVPVGEVVATQAGMPLVTVKTWPELPTPNFEKTFRAEA